MSDIWYNKHMQDENLSLVGKFFRNKWVWLVMAIDVIAIVAVVAIVIYNATKTAIISFEVAPIDATITVNGDSNYSNGSFQFHPGAYEVNISHEGLDSKNFIIELDANSNAAVTTFLSKDGDFDFYRLKDNYTSFLMLSRIASFEDNQTTDKDTSAEGFLEDFQKASQLAKQELPIVYNTYEEITQPSLLYVTTKNITIALSDDDKCQKTLCLKATIWVGDKEFVNKLLEEKGFDLKQYEVIYEVPF